MYMASASWCQNERRDTGCDNGASSGNAWKLDAVVSRQAAAQKADVLTLGS